MRFLAKKKKCASFLFLCFVATATTGSAAVTTVSSKNATADATIQNESNDKSNNHLRSSSSSSSSDSDLHAVVDSLLDRIRTAERESDLRKRETDERIGRLEKLVETLEEKTEKDRAEILSLRKSARIAEKFRRRLQISRPSVITVDGGGGDEQGEPTDPPVDPETVCLPRFRNNRCIFGDGGDNIVAIRFENEVFFNDDVEFNENVGFDSDANCMPIYNSTTETCRVNNNFTYAGGLHKFEAGTDVVVRSNEMWVRPKNTYFRNTDTVFQGGSLTVQNNVDYQAPTP